MAGKSQKLPRAVPNTLLEVQFVQRGRKLYKVLLPTPLKRNNSINASISQVTSPIIFEAKNTKGLETLKSNQPSPFLKPVTLSPAEYKAIPVFNRGMRIVDTNWLPEETERIIQLVKNHKAFQDTNIASAEAVPSKTDSTISSDLVTIDKVITKDAAFVHAQDDALPVNENSFIEFSSPTDQTMYALVNNVNEMIEEQRNSIPIVRKDETPAIPKNHEEQILTIQPETITPVCESLLPPNIKIFEVHTSRTNSPSLAQPKSTLPFNGESCKTSEDKSDVSSFTNKTKSMLPACSGNIKVAEMQSNDNTAILETSREEKPGYLKSVSTIPNGRYLLSLKENANYSAKRKLIRKLSDDNVPLVEDIKSVLSINPGNIATEVTYKGNIPSFPSEETLLLQEKLKNARTVKIQPRGNNSTSMNEMNCTMQADLGNANIIEFNSDRSSSEFTGKISPSPPTNPECEGGTIKPASIETIPVALPATTHSALPNVPTPKQVMLRLQRAENPLNVCGVPAGIALRDHDYALKEPYPKKADKHSTSSAENYNDKNSSGRGRMVSNYTLRSVLRPKELPSDMCTFVKSGKIAKSNLAAQSKARGRKPALTFHDVSALQKEKYAEKQNIMDNAINMVAPDIFSRKQLPAFLFTSSTEKQNSIETEKSDSVTGNVNSPVIKSVIKLLMPKSFSNSCSSEDTAQAISRIAKLKAVTDGAYQSYTAPTNPNAAQYKYTKAFNKSQISSNNNNFSTISHNPDENTVSSVSQTTENSKKSSSEESDSSATDEEFNIMEPEVLITESKDTLIFEDGKLKLCPARKPVNRKKNIKKLPNIKGEKHVTNHISSKKTSDEIKYVTNDIHSKKILNEENHITNHFNSKETSHISLKRTGKDLESVHKTKCQRESLLPPSPKVRKLFICRTEKAASSLLQSCFVWLDKMDEQYLNDGSLDTTEISEDVLFSLNNASQSYTKYQRGHKRYGSKAAYLDEDPIVIIEPPTKSPEVNEQSDSFSVEKVEERKEADSRMADVLRLLEEKRKAIEALRQKNTSRTVTSIISQP